MGNDTATNALAMGAKVKDKITGFTGTVTGRTEYITGCAQYLVQPPIDKEGKFVDARWIDEDRLDALAEQPATIHEVKRAGADVAAPIR